jgi:hypothetical protein
MCEACFHIQACPGHSREHYLQCWVCVQIFSLFLLKTKLSALEDVNEMTIPMRQSRMSVGHLGPETVSELLAQIDACISPGITDTQFSGLFIWCQCGLITTRRVFRDHKCRVEVIDLTSND